uniref:Uncharacterized protein n=1 Tax=Urocitellus parryii TaxID=9999 RepID=A0A8D2HY01_UROPR
MALLSNALSCHFHVPILHKQSPDRSERCGSLLPSALAGSSSDQSLRIILSLSLSFFRIGGKGRVEIDFLQRLSRRMIEGINICPG